ncbi:MAG TPA: AAA family ATPase [Micromonosporaceae bacterium]|nr:AAA family ATPase [Micromonosporaceae bacterium]
MRLEDVRDGLVVERAREFALIRDVVERAVAGKGTVALVRGPAGIGKSRLLAEAGHIARRSGAMILTAAAAVLEAEYPFGVVRQLLDVHAADPDRRAVMLRGAGAAAASVLAPGQARASIPDAQFSALHGLFWALANLAESHPMVVLVDDAQWADDASLRWVDYLARRVDDLPVALLLGWRSGERESADRMLRELEAAIPMVVVEPVALTEAGVGTLVPLVFDGKPAPSFVTACHARTGGNPFFVIELLQELRSLGIASTADGAARVAAVAPRSVGRVVLARLARLGSAASALARAVAVLGDGTHLVDAADLAGLSKPVALDAASALTVAGVLRDDGRLSITHSLMRDAIQADMGPSVQMAAHRDAARVLAIHGRGADQIAAQVVLSPPSGDGWVVARLLEAAGLAMRRRAPDVALPLLRRALEEPAPEDVLPRVLYELGLAEDALQRPEAIGHLRDARDGLPPGRERGAAALAVAHALVLAGRPAEVYEAVARAQAELGSSDHQEVRLVLEAVLLNACSFDPAGRMLLAGRVEAMAQLKGETPGERAVLAAVAFEAAKSGRPRFEVVELAERALGSGPRGYAGAADPLTPLGLAVTFHFIGMISRSVGLTTDLISEARDLGSPVLFAESSTARAHAHWRGGSLADAEADARQALASEGPRFGQAHTLATAVLIGVLTDKGQLDEASAVAESFDTPDRYRDHAIQAVADCSLAHLELALGRYEQAISRLYRAGRVIDAVGCTNPAGGEWRQPLAIALATVGRKAEAREIVTPALDAARRSREPYELGVTLRAAALIDRPTRMDMLEEAAGLLADSEIRLQYARVLVDLGVALRRIGKRREARLPLADAMDVASRSGAQPLVERARSELLASGARPRRNQRAGVDALTPSEARVARLASDGLTNREIAQHLFVSPRTVEAQLRAVYTKLHITSREMITEALGSGTS